MKIWVSARTLRLLGIVALRGRLVPEWPVYSLLSNGSGRSALAGRIDAIAYDGGRAEIVVGWKSDIDLSKTDMRVDAGQLEDYLSLARAECKG